MAWAVGLVWATQAWFSPNTQAQILTLFFSASRRWYFDFLNQSQMIFSTSSDGFAGKLVCLSEPPGILHWSSFEYWCQWTIGQVVALVDISYLSYISYKPLSLSSVSLSMKIRDNFRKMMFIVSNSVPMLCSTVLFFAANFPTLIGNEFLFF